MAVQPAEFDENLTSKDFVRMAWEASGQKDYEQLNRIVEECLKRYDEKARQLRLEVLRT